MLTFERTTCSGIRKRRTKSSSDVEKASPQEEKWKLLKFEKKLHPLSIMVTLTNNEVIPRSR